MESGSIVYEFNDYLEHFDEYAGELEEEYKQQLRHEVDLVRIYVLASA